MSLLIKSFLLMLGYLFHLPAYADHVRVAVASNFLLPSKDIRKHFEAETGHTLTFSVGASGQLFAQILQGAPYDVFLSADQERPQKLIEKGFADRETQFTYAYGKLVLYAKNAVNQVDQPSLTTGVYRRFAIANPQIAPYGKAALEALNTLGMYENLRAKLVLGTNIAQTFQFIETGNAEMGLVTLAQMINTPKVHYWELPGHLYSPIAQDAVLLKHGQNKQAALDFLRFLGAKNTRVIIQNYGYDVTAKVQ